MSLFKFNWVKKASKTLANSMGEQGFKYITGSGTYSAARMTVIYPIAESVITATSIIGDSITAITIPAGVPIPGRFSSVTVVSGSVFLYLE